MSAIFTNAEKLACAEREVKMRRRVYPAWVEKGRLSQKEADHQVACMQSIVDDYRAQVEKERLL